jgi:uncharacterized protein
MDIEIKVIPNAKRNQIKTEGSLLKVYLAAPALEGKANKALIEALAEHFAVKSRNVEIVQGLKSRLKKVRINGIAYK